MVYPSILGRGRGRGGGRDVGRDGGRDGSSGGRLGIQRRLGGRGFGHGLNGRVDIVGILNQTNSDGRLGGRGRGQLRDVNYDGRGRAASSRERNPRMYPLGNIPDETTHYLSSASASSSRCNRQS